MIRNVVSMGKENMRATSRYFWKIEAIMRGLKPIWEGIGKQLDTVTIEFEGHDIISDPCCD